ncbi:hypothetical protein BDP27DRAFT_1433710 [Rhodocollybia butyracea]|uniref:Uncharacterized protein n=1 Tax=Rhodocollybia butyracea TaxID=206335 RepID=A0A9P5P782_9AGAR|nr:hypothetical protein BDP27DRAFT_1433710 [Rhodocollybia butyracea]
MDSVKLPTALIHVLWGALDTAFSTYEQVNADDLRASSENSKAIAKLQGLISVSSSDVQELLYRAETYDKQYIEELPNLQGSAGCSIRDRNTVQLFIGHDESSYLLHKLQLLIMTKTFVEDLTLARAIVARLSATQVVSDAITPLPLRTLNDPDIMSMYLSINTCVHVLNILENAEVFSTALPDEFVSYSTLDSINTGVYRINSKPYTSHSNVQTLQLPWSKASHHDHDPGPLKACNLAMEVVHSDLENPKPESSSCFRSACLAFKDEFQVVDPEVPNLENPAPEGCNVVLSHDAFESYPSLNAMEPGVHSEFESPFTRDLDTSARLKQYNDRKIRHLFQSLDVFEAEAVASNRRKEEAFETGAHPMFWPFDLMVSQSMAHDSVDSKIEYFDNRVKLLKDKIDAAFLLSNFPGSSQGKTVLDFWKGTSFLSQLWELGRLLLYGGTDPIVATKLGAFLSPLCSSVFSELAPSDRFKFEHEFSPQLGRLEDGGHAIWGRILGHIGCVILESNLSMKPAEIWSQIEPSREISPIPDEQHSGMVLSALSSIQEASVTPTSASLMEQAEDYYSNELCGAFEASRHSSGMSLLILMPLGRVPLKHLLDNYS